MASILIKKKKGYCSKWVTLQENEKKNLKLASEKMTSELRNWAVLSKSKKSIKSKLISRHQF